jgi:outer membrane receptor for ferrienterochelin and colicins
MSLEELAKVKVFSASRHVEDAQTAPSAVTVITAEEIHRYGWRTLAEILNSVRGFYTSYDRNYSYLGAEGFSRPGNYNSRILLFVDGHRLNENVYDSAFIGTEFPLDLDLIDHIEIIRGPSSSLYGTNALFGVINVITRAARNAGETYLLELSGDASSFESRTGRVTGRFQQGLLSAMFSGSLYQSAGPGKLFFPTFDAPSNHNGVAANIDGDRYAHTFADVQYGNWKLEWLYGTRTKIVPTASFGTNFNDPGTRTIDERSYLDLGYTKSLSPHTDP